MHQLYLFLLQRAQVVFDAGAQVFGRVVGYPALIGPAGGAHFRADNQVLRVGMQGFRNQAVGDVFAVLVSSVEEVYAAGNGSFQDFQGLGPVSGLPPDFGAGQAHGAVADARDSEGVSGVLGNGDLHTAAND